MVKKKLSDHLRRKPRPIMLNDKEAEIRDDLARVWGISGSAAIRRALQLCHNKFLRKEVD